MSSVEDPEPTVEEVQQLRGAVVLEFGARWCPICQEARPLIDAALASGPEARHVRVEDGKGKRLGRHFRVKLWPTLVLLADGQERARVVRPSSREELSEALTSAFG